MRTIEEVQRAFTVGWDSVPDSWEVNRVKAEFAELALTMWHYLPNGPEKTLALRSLWRAQSEAQLGLCLQATPVSE